ncbi:MAG: asparagine synthase C-terminal domain-containing protein [Roseibium sp.]|uniref:asparagine synthase C-terminal domain-containing protein n=1 Tax=Roseibium sp. TaxID=1936156 RepID=UPI003279891F
MIAGAHGFQLVSDLALREIPARTPTPWQLFNLSAAASNEETTFRELSFERLDTRELARTILYNGDFKSCFVLNCAHELHILRPAFSRSAVFYKRVGNQVYLTSDQPDRKLLREMDLEIDSDYVRDYLYFGKFLSKRTAFRDVFELVSGSSVVLSKAGLGYPARIQDHFQSPAPHPCPPEELASCLLHKTRRAVVDTVSRFDTIGVAASGGLDSAVLSSLICEQSDKPVHLISLYSENNPELDERRQFRALGRHLRHADVHEVNVDPFYRQLDPENDFRFCWRPSSMTPAVHVNKALFGRAAELGLETVVTGDGGDQLFLNYHGEDIFADYRREGSPRRVLSALVSASLVSGKSIPRVLLEQFHKKRTRRIRTALQGLARDQDMVGCLLSGRHPSPPERESVLPFAEITKNFQYVALRHAEANTAPFETGGIALTRPLLDWDLIRFNLTLPRREHLAYGQNRILIRNAMRGRLPPEILNRHSKAVGGIQSQRATIHASARPIIEHSASFLTGFVDIDLITDAIDRDDPAKYWAIFKTMSLAAFYSGTLKMKLNGGDQ